MQVKKETQQLREFEEVLVSQYKFYLEDLEQTIKGRLPRKRVTTALSAGFHHVFISVVRLEAEEEEAQPGGGAGVVQRTGRGGHPLPVRAAAGSRSLQLPQQHHRRSRPSDERRQPQGSDSWLRATSPLVCVAVHSGVGCVLQVSTMCCDAFKKLFKQDKVGVASLAAVRVISGLVKTLSYNMKPEVE